jgi:hypothetical protein
MNIAVDSTHVYWVNADTSSTVMSVPIGGGTPTVIASGEHPGWGIAVDSKAVYWTSYYYSGIQNGLVRMKAM